MGSKRSCNLPRDHNAMLLFKRLREANFCCCKKQTDFLIINYVTRRFNLLSADLHELYEQLSLCNLQCNCQLTLPLLPLRVYKLILCDSESFYPHWTYFIHQCLYSKPLCIFASASIKLWAISLWYSSLCIQHLWNTKNISYHLLKILL